MAPRFRLLMIQDVRELRELIDPVVVAVVPYCAVEPKHLDLTLQWIFRQHIHNSCPLHDPAHGASEIMRAVWERIAQELRGGLEQSLEHTLSPPEPYTGNNRAQIELHGNDLYTYYDAIPHGNYQKHHH